MISNLIGWVIILFIVIAGLLLWIKARDMLHKPDPLALEIDPRDLPNHEHRYSLRREK